MTDIFAMPGRCRVDPVRKSGGDDRLPRLRGARRPQRPLLWRLWHRAAQQLSELRGGHRFGAGFLYRLRICTRTRWAPTG